MLKINVDEAMNQCRKLIQNMAQNSLTTTTKLKEQLVYEEQ
jgi:hypothetical protein